MGNPLKLQGYPWSQLHVQHSPSSDANLDLKDFVLAIPADVVLGTMVISLSTKRIFGLKEVFHTYSRIIRKKRIQDNTEFY